MPRLLLPLLTTVGLAGLLVSGCAPVLTPPPYMVAVWPTAGATLPVAQTTLELTFNRALSSESTWAAVWREDDGSPLTAESAVEQSNPRRLNVLLKEPVAGAYRLHWHAVAARSAVAVDGEQTFSMQDESAPTPRVAVSPLTAETGETLQVAGNGFGKRCAVRLTIGDDEQALSTAKTDVKGSFTAEVALPQSVPFGQQPVLASDTCGAAATAAVQVRWGGWPPLVAFDIGAPGPGPGQVTFWVSLRNRSDYVLERVRLVLPDPPGSSYVVADPPPKRQDQALVWEIPTIDRGLLGPFRVTYRVTGSVASHAWVEFRHRRLHGCNDDDCLPAFVSESTSESAPVAPAQSAVVHHVY